MVRRLGCVCVCVSDANRYGGADRVNIWVTSWTLLPAIYLPNLGYPDANHAHVAGQVQRFTVGNAIFFKLVSALTAMLTCHGCLSLC
jgi:hypothetical protein